MPMEDFSRHQQGIIKRYYQNFDNIQVQKLAELVSELYLTEGPKKKQKLWQAAAALMQKLEVPQARIDLLVQSADPAKVAQLVKELTGG
jgi:hypothetical protein